MRLFHGLVNQALRQKKKLLPPIEDIEKKPICVPFDDQSQTCVSPPSKNEAEHLLSSDKSLVLESEYVEFDSEFRDAKECLPSTVCKEGFDYICENLLEDMNPTIGIDSLSSTVGEFHITNYSEAYQSEIALETSTITVRESIDPYQSLSEKHIIDDSFISQPMHDIDEQLDVISEQVEIGSNVILQKETCNSEVDGIPTDYVVVKQSKGETTVLEEEPDLKTSSSQEEVQSFVLVEQLPSSSLLHHINVKPQMVEVAQSFPSPIEQFTASFDSSAGSSVDTAIEVDISHPSVISALDENLRDALFSDVTENWVNDSMDEAPVHNITDISRVKNVVQKYVEDIITHSLLQAEAQYSSSDNLEKSSYYDMQRGVVPSRDNGNIREAFQHDVRSNEMSCILKEDIKEIACFDIQVTAASSSAKNSYEKAYEIAVEEMESVGIESKVSDYSREQGSLDESYIVTSEETMHKDINKVVENISSLHDTKEYEEEVISDTYAQEENDVFDESYLSAVSRFYEEWIENAQSEVPETVACNFPTHQPLICKHSGGSLPSSECSSSDSFESVEESETEEEILLKQGHFLHRNGHDHHKTLGSRQVVQQEKTSAELTDSAHASALKFRRNIEEESICMIVTNQTQIMPIRRSFLESSITEKYDQGTSTDEEDIDQIFKTTIVCVDQSCQTDEDLFEDEDSFFDTLGDSYPIISEQNSDIVSCKAEIGIQCQMVQNSFPRRISVDNFCNISGVMASQTALDMSKLPVMPAIIQEQFASNLEDGIKSAFESDKESLQESDSFESQGDSDSDIFLDFKPSEASADQTLIRQRTVTLRSQLIDVDSGTGSISGSDVGEHFIDVDSGDYNWSEISVESKESEPTPKDTIHSVEYKEILDKQVSSVDSRYITVESDVLSHLSAKEIDSLDANQKTDVCVVKQVDSMQSSDIQLSVSSVKDSGKQKSKIASNLIEPSCIPEPDSIECSDRARLLTPSPIPIPLVPSITDIKFVEIEEKDLENQKTDESVRTNEASSLPTVEYFYGPLPPSVASALHISDGHDFPSQNMSTFASPESASNVSAHPTEISEQAILDEPSEATDDFEDVPSLSEFTLSTDEYFEVTDSVLHKKIKHAACEDYTISSNDNFKDAKASVHETTEDKQSEYFTDATTLSEFELCTDDSLSSFGVDTDQCSTASIEEFDVECMESATDSALMADEMYNVKYILKDDIAKSKESAEYHDTVKYPSEKISFDAKLSQAFPSESLKLPETLAELATKSLLQENIPQKSVDEYTNIREQSSKASHAHFLGTESNKVHKTATVKSQAMDNILGQNVVVKQNSDEPSSEHSDLLFVSASDKHSRRSSNDSADEFLHSFGTDYSASVDYDTNFPMENEPSHIVKYLFYTDEFAVKYDEHVHQVGNESLLLAPQTEVTAQITQEMFPEDYCKAGPSTQSIMSKVSTLKSLCRKSLFDTDQDSLKAEASTSAKSTLEVSELSKGNLTSEKNSIADNTLDNNSQRFDSNKNLVTSSSLQETAASESHVATEHIQSSVTVQKDLVQHALHETFNAKTSMKSTNKLTEVSTDSNGHLSVTDTSAGNGDILPRSSRDSVDDHSLLTATEGSDVWNDVESDHSVEEIEENYASVLENNVLISDSISVEDHGDVYYEMHSENLEQHDELKLQVRKDSTLVHSTETVYESDVGLVASQEISQSIASVLPIEKPVLSLELKSVVATHESLSLVEKAVEKDSLQNEPSITLQNSAENLPQDPGKPFPSIDENVLSQCDSEAEPADISFHSVAEHDDSNEETNDFYVDFVQDNNISICADDMLLSELPATAAQSANKHQTLFAEVEIDDTKIAANKPQFHDLTHFVMKDEVLSVAPALDKNLPQNTTEKSFVCEHSHEPQMTLIHEVDKDVFSDVPSSPIVVDDDDEWKDVEDFSTDDDNQYACLKTEDNQASVCIREHYAQIGEDSYFESLVEPTEMFHLPGSLYPQTGISVSKETSELVGEVVIDTQAYFARECEVFSIKEEVGILSIKNVPFESSCAHVSSVSYAQDSDQKETSFSKLTPEEITKSSADKADTVADFSELSQISDFPTDSNGLDVLTVSQASVSEISLKADSLSVDDKFIDVLSHTPPQAEESGESTDVEADYLLEEVGVHVLPSGVEKSTDVKCAVFEVDTAADVSEISEVSEFLTDQNKLESFATVSDLSTSDVNKHEQKIVHDILEADKIKEMRGSTGESIVKEPMSIQKLGLDSLITDVSEMSEQSTDLNEIQNLITVSDPSISEFNLSTESLSDSKHLDDVQHPYTDALKEQTEVLKDDVNLKDIADDVKCRNLKDGIYPTSINVDERLNDSTFQMLEVDVTCKEFNKNIPSDVFRVGTSHEGVKSVSDVICVDVPFHEELKENIASEIPKVAIADEEVKEISDKVPVVEITTQAKLKEIVTPKVLSDDTDHVEKEVTPKMFKNGTAHEQLEDTLYEDAEEVTAYEELEDTAPEEFKECISPEITMVDVAQKEMKVIPHTASVETTAHSEFEKGITNKVLEKSTVQVEIKEDITSSASKKDVAYDGIKEDISINISKKDITHHEQQKEIIASEVLSDNTAHEELKEVTGQAEFKKYVAPAVLRVVYEDVKDIAAVVSVESVDGDPSGEFKRDISSKKHGEDLDHEKFKRVIASEMSGKNSSNEEIMGDIAAEISKKCVLEERKKGIYTEISVGKILPSHEELKDIISPKAFDDDTVPEEMDEVTVYEELEEDTAAEEFKECIAGETVEETPHGDFSEITPTSKELKECVIYAETMEQMTPETLKEDSVCEKLLPEELEKDVYLKQLPEDLASKALKENEIYFHSRAEAIKEIAATHAEVHTTSLQEKYERYESNVSESCEVTELSKDTSDDLVTISTAAASELSCASESTGAKFSAALEAQVPSDMKTGTLKELGESAQSLIASKVEDVSKEESEVSGGDISETGDLITITDPSLSQFSISESLVEDNQHINILGTTDMSDHVEVVEFEQQVPIKPTADPFAKTKYDSNEEAKEGKEIEICEADTSADFSEIEDISDWLSDSKPDPMCNISGESSEFISEDKSLSQVENTMDECHFSTLPKPDVHPDHFASQNVISTCVHEPQDITGDDLQIFGEILLKPQDDSDFLQEHMKEEPNGAISPTVMPCTADEISPTVISHSHKVKEEYDEKTVSFYSASHSSIESDDVFKSVVADQVSFVEATESFQPVIETSDILEIEQVSASPDVLTLPKEPTSTVKSEMQSCPPSDLDSTPLKVKIAKDHSMDSIVETVAEEVDFGITQVNKQTKANTLLEPDSCSENIQVSCVQCEYLPETETSKLSETHILDTTDAKDVSQLEKCTAEQKSSISHSIVEPPGLEGALHKTTLHAVSIKLDEGIGFKTDTNQFLVKESSEREEASSFGVGIESCVSASVESSSVISTGRESSVEDSEIKICQPLSVIRQIHKFDVDSKYMHETYIPGTPLIASLSELCDQTMDDSDLLEDISSSLHVDESSSSTLFSAITDEASHLDVSCVSEISSEKSSSFFDPLVSQISPSDESKSEYDYCTDKLIGHKEAPISVATSNTLHSSELSHNIPLESSLYSQNQPPVDIRTSFDIGSAMQTAVLQDSFARNNLQESAIKSSLPPLSIESLQSSVHDTAINSDTNVLNLHVVNASQQSEFQQSETVDSYSYGPVEKRLTTDFVREEVEVEVDHSDSNIYMEFGDEFPCDTTDDFNFETGGHISENEVESSVYESWSDRSFELDENMLQYEQCEDEHYTEEHLFYRESFVESEDEEAILREVDLNLQKVDEIGHVDDIENELYEPSPDPLCDYDLEFEQSDLILPPIDEDVGILYEEHNDVTVDDQSYEEYYVFTETSENVSGKTDSFASALFQFPCEDNNVSPVDEDSAVISTESHAFSLETQAKQSPCEVYPETITVDFSAKVVTEATCLKQAIESISQSEAVTEIICPKHVTESVPQLEVVTEAICSKHITESIPSKTTTESIQFETKTESIQSETITESIQSVAVTESIQSVAVTASIPSEAITKLIQSKAVAESIQSKAVPESLQSETVTESLQSETVTESICPKHITESISSKTMTESIPSKTMTVSIQSETITESIQSVAVTASTPSEAVTASTPSEAVTKSIQSEDVTKSIQSEAVPESLQSEAVAESLQPETVTESIHPKHVAESIHPKHVTGSIHSVDVTASIPSKAMTKSIQSETVGESIQSKDMTESIQFGALTESIQSVAVTESIQSVAVTESIQSVAVTASIPSEAVTKSIQSETVGESIQSKAMTESIQFGALMESIQSETVAESIHSESIPESVQSKTVTESICPEAISEVVYKENESKTVHLEETKEIHSKSVITDFCTEAVTASFGPESMSGTLRAERLTEESHHSMTVLTNTKNIESVLSQESTDIALSQINSSECEEMQGTFEAVSSSESSICEIEIDAKHSMVSQPKDIEIYHSASGFDSSQFSSDLTSIHSEEIKVPELPPKKPNIGRKSFSEIPKGEEERPALPRKMLKQSLSSTSDAYQEFDLDSQSSKSEAYMNIVSSKSSSRSSSIYSIEEEGELIIVNKTPSIEDLAQTAERKKSNDNIPVRKLECQGSLPHEEAIQPPPRRRSRTAELTDHPIQDSNWKLPADLQGTDEEITLQRRRSSTPSEKPLVPLPKKRLSIEDRMAKLQLEGKCTDRDKAFIAAKLIEMQFEEDDALLASKQCSSVYHAVKFLTQLCEMCNCRYPIHQMASMVHCPHKACRECLSAHFTTLIYDRSIFAFLCPVCHKPDISDQNIQDYFNHLDMMLRRILKKEMYDMFQRKLRDEVLTKDPNFHWCSQCSSGFIASPRLKKLYCPDCSAITCALCHQTWELEHEGVHCERFQQWKDMHTPEPPPAGLVKALAERGITCPSCGIKFAHASGGCMLYKCAHCSFEFCAFCLKPYNKGKECSKTPACETMGLHCHHPYNCLFFLRDREPAELQQLLIEENVPFLKIPPPDQIVKTRCQVREQKHVHGTMAEDRCGRSIEPYFAGLCRVHYKEYLAELLRKYKINPVTSMTTLELQYILRKARIFIPERIKGETSDEYYKKILKIVTTQLAV